VSIVVILQDSGVMERSARRRTLQVKLCYCRFWHHRWIKFFLH